MSTVQVKNNPARVGKSYETGPAQAVEPNGPGQSEESLIIATIENKKPIDPDVISSVIEELLIRNRPEKANNFLQRVIKADYKDLKPKTITDVAHKLRTFGKDTKASELIKLAESKGYKFPAEQNSYPPVREGQSNTPSTLEQVTLHVQKPRVLEPKVTRTITEKEVEFRSQQIIEAIQRGEKIDLKAVVSIVCRLNDNKKYEEAGELLIAVIQGKNYDGRIKPGIIEFTANRLNDQANASRDEEKRKQAYQLLKTAIEAGYEDLKLETIRHIARGAYANDNHRLAKDLTNLER